ncbi:RES family NAD+ phosphorylase [Runella limosa]|uniref:RES family NAD+ phosphorylase n=1 Tax=Runella limosa TaxID=370978 RepID=UPI0004006D66|nr:RES family NAD+ phosphorylase [Runella limosa]MCA0232224.1 RES family NAD+ phosphorylase [Bacteroidota bacterium]
MGYIFRLQKAKFSSVENILSGYGAKLLGGRWNSIGKAVVYTSATPELALVETLVHLEGFYFDELPAHVLATIEVPENAIIRADVAELPSDWNSLHTSPATQQFTDNWLKQQSSLVMAVPSVIVPMSFNYLINPNHPRMNEIKVVECIPFSFDSRFFK